MEELFTDFGKALIRTPLYSFGQLFNNDGSTNDLGVLVLKSLNDPIFLEALYCSSPQVYERVKGLKAGTLNREKEKDLLNTLKKYLIRAHTRPTPYGIFAGTDFTTVNGEGDDAGPMMRRNVRIDSGLLEKILDKIETDPAVYPQLRYSLNNSLYHLPGQFRFTETILKDGKTHYQLSSLEDIPLLTEIYRLKPKHLLPRQIFEQCAFDLPFSVFNSFLEELVKSQFLFSELRQGPTISNYINQYLEILQNIEKKGFAEVEKYIILISTLQTAAQDFEDLPLGSLPLGNIKEINEHLKKCSINASQDHFFHVDLRKRTAPGFILTSEQVSQIKKGVFIFAKLSPGNESESDTMSFFKSSFVKKYGSREIPLSHALDPEYGIGFPATEKIGDTIFNALVEKVKDPAEKDNQKQKKEVLQKTQLTYFPGTEEIRIEDKDLPVGGDALSKVPSYLSVIGSILPSGQILMEGVGKAHANALPGRFASLDKRTYKLCKEIAADEENKDQEVVFAEIVFQPAGRIGNIAQRPSFFQYEIPYLATAGVNEEKQLPVSDLLLSVRNNELLLRSARLNKRVIPRLSNAHNFAISTLPVYQFLSSLQYPNETHLKIDWGHPGLKRRFLPRVTYQNMILHRSRWFLYKEDIACITGDSDPVSVLNEFLLKWKVARLVAIADGDNELFIDTHNPEYLQLMLTEIQKRRRVELVEWVYGIPSFESFEEVNSVQQFILPLAKRNGESYKPFTKKEPDNRFKETFPPGSEWIYFKIYCTAGFSDKILMEVIKPSIDYLLKEKVIRNAFFIRYTDPDYHIRFRLQLQQDYHQNDFATSFGFFTKRIQSFTESGIVWDLQLDTYIREIERYGEQSIIDSEEVFFYDSRLFLKCLGHQVFAGNDETRFFAGIKNLDKWLSLFHLSLKEKICFCESVMENLSKELGPDVKFRVDLQYRQLSHLIPTFLDSFIFNTEFQERESNLMKLFLSEKNLCSYIHMSMNRWFVTEQRLMEYMCYLFACKHYKQIVHYQQNN